MKDEEERLLSQNPPASKDEIFDMVDGKLTNFISDLKKSDRQYRSKVVYFREFLDSGRYPNAVETFERKGHGTINIRGGGKKNKKTRKNRRRRGGGEAEQVALVDAVKRGTLDDIKTAISRGADVNTGVGTQTPPLSLAIHKNRLDVVKLLVESGADVNRQDRLGGVPIVDAGEDHPEILGFLISRGAKYPAGWPMSARLRTLFEKQGAIEVGVKKDMPTPVPSIIKGFLGSSRRTRR